MHAYNLIFPPTPLQQHSPHNPPKNPYPHHYIPLYNLQAKPLLLQKTLKIPNYTIHRKDDPTSDTNKLRDGMLIAIRNSIPSENIPQPTSPNIEFLTKTTPTITIRAAYTPPKTNISSSDLDFIILHNDPGHYFNVKHYIWNNPGKNRNSSIINHAELQNYPPTLTGNLTALCLTSISSYQTHATL
ncbi:unnamed protein product [Heterotrigona itama]|uniref:Uncharacterized protein n=1 Tax=Heterotrigona itama TaxID=395501 RepID=A0A6V7H1L4_9HYME|nr:unnamed protein product [Heterotrigona itama]